MKQIYLDSCILVAYYSKKETDKRKLIRKCLKTFQNLEDTIICTSDWAVAEMANVLISRMKMRISSVSRYEEELRNERRLYNLKIKLVDVSPKKDYDFGEFFYHIRKGVIQYHSGVGDIIHSVIMKNNNIRMILTFDEKDDFKQIPDLLVIHPRDISIVKNMEFQKTTPSKQLKK